MIGLQLSPSSVQTVLPPTPKTRVSGRRSQGYKKIRWRTCDPSKKGPIVSSDQFVQWQPPGSTEDEADAADRTDSSKCQTKKSGHEKDPSPPQALVAVSPVQPLPCNGTRVDPFLTLPIKATETVQDTMDYFVTICKGFGTENSVIPGPVNPHLSLLLPYALKHALLFESMIAVCRASILISLGRPIWEDYAFVHHRGSTIAALNTRLKTKEATDDAALLTVTMLMTLEYLSGNHHGVLMHCTGLEKMLELRGPISEEAETKSESDWLKFVKLGLTAYKALGSFVTGQPPDVPSDSISYLSETFHELHLDRPLYYPATPFPPDLCVILSRLPSGLSELGLTTQISVQMINLLAAIAAATTLMTSATVSYHTILDGTYTPPSSEPSPSIHDDERRATMLQTILSSLQRMSLTTTNPIEYHLTSGLLAYLFQLRGLVTVNLFYDPILRKFITTLPHHAKPTSPQEQHALIWSSMAVAGTLSLRAVPMPDSHTVMDHALDLYPATREWRHLDRILRTFFYTDAIGAHWRRVWQSAMNRREFLLRQCRPSADVEFVLDHDRPSHPEQEPDTHSETIRAHVRQHMAGAPKSMREMSQAMGLCPFRSQVMAAAAGTANVTAPPGTVGGMPSPRTVSTPSTAVS